jgi:hypothetical protein
MLVIASSVISSSLQQLQLKVSNISLYCFLLKYGDLKLNATEVTAPLNMAIHITREW